MKGPYDDIIDLPHWDPKRHQRLSIRTARRNLPLRGPDGLEG
jgi:hypothetical protein